MPNALLTELIARHKPIAEEAARLKELEMKFRQKIVSLAFPNYKIGTNNLDLLEDAISLKATIKESIKLDEAGIRDLVDCIPDNAGLLKETYSMSVSKYRKLAQEYKDLLADNVTIKEDSPSLVYDGETPPEGVLRGISTREGVLFANDLPLDAVHADSIAQSVGLMYAEQLVRLLDELQ